MPSEDTSSSSDSQTPHMDLISVLADTRALFESQVRATAHFFKQLQEAAESYISLQQDRDERAKAAEEADNTVKNLEKENERLQKQMEDANWLMDRKSALIQSLREEAQRWKARFNEADEERNRLIEENDKFLTDRILGKQIKDGANILSSEGPNVHIPPTPDSIFSSRAIRTTPSSKENLVEEMQETNPFPVGLSIMEDNLSMVSSLTSMSNTPSNSRAPTQDPVTLSNTRASNSPTPLMRKRKSVKESKKSHNQKRRRTINSSEVSEVEGECSDRCSKQAETSGLRIASFSSPATQASSSRLLGPTDWPEMTVSEMPLRSLYFKAKGIDNDSETSDEEDLSS